MVPGNERVNVELLSLSALVMLVSFVGACRLASPGSWFALLDHPNERSLHTVPTPRTGGLAILGSVAAGLLIAGLSARAGFGGGSVLDPDGGGKWLWIMGLVVMLGLISFWDDRVGLPPFGRLAVHGLAALGVVYGAGVAVTAVPLPTLGSFPLGWAAGPLTVLGLMWMTNLYNFMDGMDGFASGMTVLGFGTIGYLASQAGSCDVTLVAFCVAAGGGGFLILNRPPARIFMGDVGSVPLGFLAGAFAVLGVQDGVFDLWAPLLIFSPFIVDATVTLMRRLARRETVWAPHRQHYYQRLVLAGWGHWKTITAEFGLMLACAVSAWAYSLADDIWRASILVVWAGLYVGLAWAVGWVERHRIQPAVQSGVIG